MPTIDQIRAARALIGWSQGELAKHSGLSQTGIARIENGTNHPNSSTLGKIIKAFDARGVEFLGENGVKKRTNEIRKLRGKDAMSDFLDDVYQMILDTGTPEKPTQLFMYNVAQSNWTKWMGQERWNNHHKRMSARKECIDCRTILKEGDDYYPSAAWTEYKWFPKEIFSDKTFYSYGSKLAFLQFFEDDMEVMIMDNADFAEGYNNLFLIAWNSVAIVPPAQK